MNENEFEFFFPSSLVVDRTCPFLDMGEFFSQICGLSRPKKLKSSAILESSANTSKYSLNSHPFIFFKKNKLPTRLSRLTYFAFDLCRSQKWRRPAASPPTLSSRRPSCKVFLIGLRHYFPIDTIFFSSAPLNWPKLPQMPRGQERRVLHWRLHRDRVPRASLRDLHADKDWYILK